MGGSWRSIVLVVLVAPAVLPLSLGAIAEPVVIGGAGDDWVEGLALGHDGAVFVVGRTDSADLPLTRPWQSNLRGTSDAFLMKVDANGTPIFSTYLGGSYDEQGLAVAALPDGGAVITGWTTSFDFPLVQPMQRTKGNCDDGSCQDATWGQDAFVSYFDAAGSLRFSTYLGGLGYDAGYAVAVDQAGVVGVAGVGEWLNFPLRSPYYAGKAGDEDNILFARFAQDGTWLSATFVGAASGEHAAAVAVDPAGNWILAGTTGANVDHNGVKEFPRTRGMRCYHPGDLDTFAVVVNLSSRADRLHWSACVEHGGAQWEALAVDASGRIWTGGLARLNMPYAGPSLGVLLELAPNADIVGRYAFNDSVAAPMRIAFDSEKRIVVVGDTLGAPLPVVRAFQAEPGGHRDAFFGIFDVDADAWTLLSYDGGPERDFARGLASDGAGRVLYGGATAGGLPGAPAPRGGYDGFLRSFRLPLPPTAVQVAHAGPGALALSWSPSPDAVAYLVSRDGVDVARVAELSWTDVGLGTNATHRYQIVSEDATGLVGRPSALVQGTTMRPPGPPVVQADRASVPGAIDVSWTAPAFAGDAPIEAYRVYAGDASGGETYLTTVDGLAFREEGLPDSHARSYRVAAVNAAGEGPLAPAAMNRTIGVPFAPGAVVVARAGAGNLSLSWAPADDGGSALATYVIRAGSSTEALAPVATLDAGITTWTDRGLAPGEVRWYSVAATNAYGEGAASAPVQGVAATVPGAVVLRADPVPYGPVRLSWTQAADGGAPLLHYVVTRDRGDGPPAVIAETTARSFQDEECPLRSICVYRVSAVNGAGQGPVSNQASRLGATYRPAFDGSPYNDVNGNGRRDSGESL